MSDDKINKEDLREGDSLTLESGECITFLEAYNEHRYFDFIARNDSGDLRNYRWHQVGLD